MSYKEFEDEAAQRNVKVLVRDSKGRFAKAKPLKPVLAKIPAVKNRLPQKDKWGCECGGISIELEPTLTKFKKIQVKMNPRKDCKDIFEEAHRILIASGGMISKVLDKKTNKPYGFLVRIPSSTNPDVIFMRFIKYNPYNSNTYFQKVNAIVSTMIRGERWLEKWTENEYALENIPFEVYYKSTNRVLSVEDDLTSLVSAEPIWYVNGRYINEIEREGYTLDKDMMYYINRFEKKARDYYKNNKNNKYFVALPFI